MKYQFGCFVIKRILMLRARNGCSFATLRCANSCLMSGKVRKFISSNSSSGRGGDGGGGGGGGGSSSNMN